jgi:hypothetical protein
VSVDITREKLKPGPQGIPLLARELKAPYNFRLRVPHLGLASNARDFWEMING